MKIHIRICLIDGERKTLYIADGIDNLRDVDRELVSMLMAVDRKVLDGIGAAFVLHEAKDAWYVYLNKYGATW